MDVQICVVIQNGSETDIKGAKGNLSGFDAGIFDASFRANRKFEKDQLDIFQYVGLFKIWLAALFVTI